MMPVMERTYFQVASPGVRSGYIYLAVHTRRT